MSDKAEVQSLQKQVKDVQTTNTLLQSERDRMATDLQVCQINVKILISSSKWYTFNYDRFVLIVCLQYNNDFGFSFCNMTGCGSNASRAEGAGLEPFIVCLCDQTFTSSINFGINLHELVLKRMKIA